MAAPAPFMRNPSTRRSRRSRTDQEHDDHENREYGNDWNGDLRLYQRPADEADTEYERPESGVQPELRHPGEFNQDAGGKPDADDVYLRSKERPSGASNLRQRSVYGECTSFCGEGVYLKVTGLGIPASEQKSESINYQTSAGVDQGWVRLSVTFTPQSSGTCTIGVYNQ